MECQIKRKISSKKSRIEERNKMVEFCESTGAKQQQSADSSGKKKKRGTGLDSL